MGRRLGFVSVIAALWAASQVQASAAPGAFTPPHWLKVAEKQTLDRVFGGARPSHTYYISYPRKIAVIFEFARVVDCRTCTGPMGATPGGRVIRVSFDRQKHRLNGAMQFCESRGSRPSRALCLRR